MVSGQRLSSTVKGKDVEQQVTILQYEEKRCRKNSFLQFFNFLILIDHNDAELNKYEKRPVIWKRLQPTRSKHLMMMRSPRESNKFHICSFHWQVADPPAIRKIQQIVLHMFSRKLTQCSNAGIQNFVFLKT